MDENIMLYNVVGKDDLEGTVFARCTTRKKAENAQALIEKEGFEDMLEIVRDEIPLDTVSIGDEFVRV